VRKEIARVLASPQMILAECQRLQSENGDAANVTTLNGQLETLDNQKRRLVKLYQMGEVDDDYYRVEAEALRARRQVVDDRLGRERPEVPKMTLECAERACRRVREWVERAGGNDFNLLAEALQIQVLAEKGRSEVTGVIPDYAPDCSHADVRAVVGSFARVRSAIEPTLA
jgi:hypothetical protein